MLGQYRIVSEIFIFGIGLVIASFVAVTFDDMRVSISESSARDQMVSVANVISSSLIKAMAGGTTIRLQVPETISGEVYIISFQSSNGDACIISNCMLRLTTVERRITVTQQLFNISQSHIINGNVYSSARYIEISSSGNVITVERA